MKDLDGLEVRKWGGYVEADLQGLLQRIFVAGAELFSF